MGKIKTECLDNMIEYCEDLKKFPDNRRSHKIPHKWIEYGLAEWFRLPDNGICHNIVVNLLMWITTIILVIFTIMVGWR